MAEFPNYEQLEQVVARIKPGGKLLRHWTLTGGISAQVTGLEISLPDGQIRKLVLRRHGAADLQENPHIAADEFTLLQILSANRLPAPAPYHLDESCTILPTPYLVVEFIDGVPDFAPANLPDFLSQLAAVLAQIHGVDGSDLALSFLPCLADRIRDVLDHRPNSPDESLDEGRIRDALEAVWPTVQLNPLSLLHGDFWPGNLLWKAGQLLAVIDWEDALVGDPLADLANARMEMLWAFGGEAMQEFTYRYQSLMPALDFTHLAFWDLWAALRPAGRLSGWGLDADTEAQMRRLHKEFIAGAFEKFNRA